jgi:xylulokinase
MALYLGLDSSTQSLTAIVIDAGAARRAVVWQHALTFDAALPAYGTRHGVLPHDDPQIAVSPPRMWAEALDLMMAELARSGLDLTGIAAIAGSAQQHGSVYLNTGAAARLAALDPARPLAGQLDGIFSRPVSPIWMDSSTSAECAEITAAMGGAARVARLTGSRAFERFTAAQIRRWWHRAPAEYAATDRIHLVSSFMAALLVGQHAPLDPGDASGMNLMDLARRAWAPDALAATAPSLSGKLPPIVPSASVVGTLARYWRARYGLPAAKVVAWSGDNPSSLVGTGLVREDLLAVSLGTSDTVFGLMREPRVDASGTGHVFASPTGDYMGLTCFKNGSLARERIRDEHGLDWAGFSAALDATPPGNGGALMLPWFEPEITPDVPTPGVHRTGLDAADAAANVRAVAEAQMMATANHSQWMARGAEARVSAIYATGGGAANRALLRVMADVFDADVYQFDVGNSACLGAALRAWHADARASGTEIDWPEIVRGFAEPVAASKIAPIPEHVRVYADLRRRYAAFEKKTSEVFFRKP